MLNPNNLCPGCMNEKVAEGKCPICGYNPEEPHNPQYLVPGSILDNRYIIGKALENNGEDVTYLGYDTVTATTVNIIEFFPTGICERDSDGASVVMLSGSEYNYNDALTKFLELSRTLFRLNEIPALIDVLDIREANNTAYRITRSIPGITLKLFLIKNGGLLTWDQTRSLFAPLIASISALHSAGIVHRGISPETIIVGKDGKLRLSGFCIAESRTAKSSLTSQLFPGFAAIEQYTDEGTQGPWTDVYAFAATIYRTLVGNPPPEATLRLEGDNMTIPAKIARETPEAVLKSLANALQIMPKDRTQNIDEMRRGLSVSSAQLHQTAQPAVVPVNTGSAEHTASKPVQKSAGKNNNTGKMYGVVAGIVTAFLLAIIIIFVLWILGFIGNDSTTGDNGGNPSRSYSEPTNSNTPSAASKIEMTDDKQKLELPNLVGMNYAEIDSIADYKDKITFKIVGKRYNDYSVDNKDYKYGDIVSQSPAPYEVVPVGTTVEVVLSLGNEKFICPDILGKNEIDALFLLLEAGFKYNNIKIESMEDKTKPFGVVVFATPGIEESYDTKGNKKLEYTTIDADSYITIFINSYSPPAVEVDPPTGDNSSVVSSTEAE